MKWLVWHTILLEVNFLRIEGCLVEGRLVEVVIVMNKSPVGHLTRVRAVLIG